MSRATSINEKINELLSASGGEVEKRVIDARVERGLGERVRLFDKAITSALEMEAELAKASKPDQRIVNLDGAVQSEGFSPGRVEQIKKVRKKLEKPTAAIEKAISDGDWKELKKVVN